MSDEYEIVSRKELEALQKEVRELKARPVQPPSADLMQALDRLSGHIQHLIKVFEHADKEITEEYHSGVHKETDKLDLVIAQNEQIAKGLLHMSDLMQKPHKAPAHQHKSLFSQRPQQTDDDTQEEKRYPLRKNATNQYAHMQSDNSSLPETVEKTPKPSSLQPADLPPPPPIEDTQESSPVDQQDIPQPINDTQESPPELPEMPPPPENVAPEASNDEQMPTLPPPPEETSSSTSKHSRKSLMNSFK